MSIEAIKSQHTILLPMFGQMSKDFRASPEEWVRVIASTLFVLGFSSLMLAVNAYLSINYLPFAEKLFIGWMVLMLTLIVANIHTKVNRLKVYADLRKQYRILSQRKDVLENSHSPFVRDVRQAITMSFASLSSTGRVVMLVLFVQLVYMSFSINVELSEQDKFMAMGRTITLTVAAAIWLICALMVIGTILTRRQFSWLPDFLAESSETERRRGEVGPSYYVEWASKDESIPDQMDIALTGRVTALPGIGDAVPPEIDGITTRTYSSQCQYYPDGRVMFVQPVGDQQKQSMPSPFSDDKTPGGDA